MTKLFGPEIDSKIEQVRKSLPELFPWIEPEKLKEIGPYALTHWH